MTMFKVEFMSEYENPIAQAASASAGLGVSLGNALGKAAVTGLAENAVFSGPDADLILDAWQELEIANDVKAMASMKAAMARQSRGLFGFGCKVKGGQLIGTKVGAGRGKKAGTKLEDAIKAFEAWGSEEQKTQMLELVMGAADRYKSADGEKLVG